MSDPSTPEPDTVDEEASAPESRRSRAAAGSGSRRALSMRGKLIVLGSVVAALAIVLTVLLLTQQRGVEPLTVETTTITLPPPTPDQDPIERDTSTALLAALPGTVLGYAVSDQTEAAALADLDANEGWQLTYTSSSREVVLLVGQWLDEADATAAADTFTGEGEVLDEGDVLVAGEKVGSFVTIAVDEATERTVWTNRTALFVAEGPTGSTGAFYLAFPF